MSMVHECWAEDAQQRTMSMVHECWAEDAQQRKAETWVADEACSVAVGHSNSAQEAGRA